MNLDEEDNNHYSHLAELNLIDIDLYTVLMKNPWHFGTI
jgi:hypothetical protein